MALGKPRSTEHLVVANCVLRTSCAHFKFGTETAGDLRDVSVTNCVMLRRPDGRKGLGGIAIESVDGSHVDGVAISNISMEDVVAPIFIRLGNRGRGMNTPAPGSIKNISIQNVVARGAALASSITGIENGRIQNVTIEASTSLAPAAPRPGTSTFRRLPRSIRTLTYLGIARVSLIRQACRGLTLRNVKVHAAEPDGRPAMVLDDVAHLEISAFDSTNVPPHQPMLLFQNVAGALLYGNRLSSAADVFSAF